MNSSQITYLVILLLYLAGMLILGFYMTKKVKNTSTYYTGDRSMNAAVTGFSYSATQMSSGSVVGTPSTIYTLGYAYATTGFASTAAPWFSFLLMGERVRKICERVGAVDYGDMLGVRYHKITRMFYSIIILLFYIPLIVAQIAAGGTLINTLIGVDYNIAVTLLGLVIIVYTVTGGMNSVAWTDYVQGIVMMLGIGLLCGICLYQVGGFSEMNAAAAAIAPEKMVLTGTVTRTWLICNILTWSILQVGGATGAVVRFLIPKDVPTLRKALGYSVVFQSFIFITVSIVGVCGLSLLPNLEKPDQIVAQLTGMYMPPILGGILVAGIVAALMSTVDSALLLCSSAASNGLYKGFINPDADMKSQLKVGRIATIVIGLIALLMAYKPFAAIQWMVTFSFNVFSAALTFPILFAIWWPRCSKTAGVVGMAVGTIVSLSWYAIGYAQYQSFSNWPGGIWPGVIGTICCGIAMVITTKLTPAPEQEVIDTFYIE